MTDVESTSKAGEGAPPAEPEVPVVLEPRITNNSEGKKKQKEAVKRLSDYSREARSKRADEPVADSPRKPELAADDSADARAPPPESAMSVGNIIAAAGVAVAVVCLYLSYTRPKKVREEEPPEAPPKAAREPSSAPRNAPKPKFRKL